jgi:hypothetical protein
MTKEEREKWHKAAEEAVLKALREAGEERRQRLLKEQSEAESLKTASSEASPVKTQNWSESSPSTGSHPEEEAIDLTDHPMAELFARILPPSEDILRTNRALSAMPLKQRSPEEVINQVKEHLRQAAEEMSRHGQIKKER